MSSMHNIKLKEEISPILHPPREINAGIQKKIKEELNKIEKTDMIRKIDKPAEWVNNDYSLVVVEKLIEELIICLSHRDLTKVIEKKH